MALAAKISPAELTAQVTSRFDGAYLEARLINAPGTIYVPGITDDATFLGFEVTAGIGGYERQTISYLASDVTNYTDDGVALTTRATVFAHDGVGAPIDFSHVALVWSEGNVGSLGSVQAAPSAGVNGTYTNIPIDSTSGTGEGLTIDLTISNSGASSSDFSIALNKAGRGYSPSEVLSILDGTLAGLGAVAPGAGNLSFTVATTSDQANSGQVLAIAQTSNAVQLSGGNEAAFYWNLKQFGFYSVS